MEGDDRSIITPGKTKLPKNTPARNFVQKAASSTIGERILPHYLRSSTGSCHDFCKFGKQHEFDANSRSSMPKKFTEVSWSPERKKTLFPAKPLSVSKSFDSGEQYSPSKTTINREMTILSSARPKMNSSTSKKSNSSKSIIVRENTRRQKNRDVRRTEGSTNIVSKKCFSSPKASLSSKPVAGIPSSAARKHQSQKVSSSGNNPRSRIQKDESNKHEYEEVEEKILYVIKIETGKKPRFGSSSSSHGEEFDHDEGENTIIDPENESLSEIDNIKEVIDKKGSFKKVDFPPPSNKKIIDPRKNRKKFEEFECEMTPNGENPEKKVVLRHQDLRGKKDSRGLFNDIIEEMASKLVETRKSKVKALVDAFETVISRQVIEPLAR